MSSPPKTVAMSRAAWEFVNIVLGAAEPIIALHAYDAAKACLLIAQLRTYPAALPSPGIYSV